MLAAKIGYFRPRGFDPRSISGLAVWLDAADYNASTGAWDDKSGNGRNFSQGVTNDRPTKTLTINGRDVVSFDGSNDHLQGPQVSFQQWSVFAVVRADRTTGDNGIITADPSIVGTRGPQFLRWSGTAYQTVGFQATNSARVESSSVTVVTGTARIVATVQGASAFEMWTNNTSNGSTTCTQQAYTAAMAIGAATYNTTPNASGFMDGDVGEILLYSRALTTLERESVQRYLGGRWGVTLPPEVSNADAQSWINRVYANGGEVSTTTANAVNDFCAAIDAAGIRDRFYRLNLFAGTGLAAALVPLYRGQSLGGTQLGGTTDTNANFVAGDYVETGATGGLQGNGSTKSLNTGLAPSALPTTSRHLGFYANTTATADFTTYIGCRQGAGSSGGNWFVAWRAGSNSLTMHTLGGNQGPFRGDVASHGNGFYIATNDSTTGSYYRNGSSVDATDTGQTPEAGSTRNVTVFALNFEGGVGTQVNARMSGYTIGEALTGSQASALNAAMQAFQTALTRNV